MALPTSGTISLNDVNLELGNSGTASISLNDSAVRNLAGVSSGTISLASLYGASASISIPTTGRIVGQENGLSLNTSYNLKAATVSPDGRNYIPYSGPKNFGFLAVDSSGVAELYTIAGIGGTQLTTCCVHTDANYIYIFAGYQTTSQVWQDRFFGAKYQKNGSGGYDLIASKQYAPGTEYLSDIRMLNVIEEDSNYIYLSVNSHSVGAGYRITKSNMNATRWSQPYYPSVAGGQGTMVGWKGYSRREFECQALPDLAKGSFSGTCAMHFTNCSNSTLEGYASGTGRSYTLGATTGEPRQVMDIEADGSSSHIVIFGASKSSQNKLFFARVDPTYNGATPWTGAVSNIYEFTFSQNVFDSSIPASGITYVRGYLRWIPSYGKYLFAASTYNGDFVITNRVVYGYFDDTTQQVTDSCIITNSGNFMYGFNSQHQDFGDALNGVPYIIGGPNYQLIPAIIPSSTATYVGRSGNGTYTIAPLSAPTKAAAGWSFAGSTLANTPQPGSLSYTVPQNIAISGFPNPLNKDNDLTTATGYQFINNAIT